MIVLDWSVAEMLMVSTLKTPELLVTTGVLQPQMPEVKLTETFPAQYIKVYPTITEDFITVASTIPTQGSLKITVTDILGRSLKLHTQQISGLNVLDKIPVGELPHGIYFLNIWFINPAGSNAQLVYKFLKL